MFSQYYSNRKILVNNICIIINHFLLKIISQKLFGFLLFFILIQFETVILVVFKNDHTNLRKIMFI